MNSIVIVITAAGRYHNGLGYSHHPSFGMDVFWANETEIAKIPRAVDVAHGCIKITELEGSDNVSASRQLALQWLEADAERFIRTLDQQYGN